MAGIEIDQEVQIAIGPEAQRQHRPEQRKPTYVVSLAKLALRRNPTTYPNGQLSQKRGLWLA
jgi:hypothetical protein